ncbi:hypothetical protein HF086_005052 [Spodoptera exigua]|uniref:Uncharacterized protein n=1 Tax=Spodoptera exigua TaxID=7107 RepID=A0A922SD21_SPOEX|nr:hypothetical protein HF086_005052 [Spodoptera exigua]
MSSIYKLGDRSSSSFSLQLLVEHKGISNMSPFAFAFLCMQACLVQNVFGQCTSPAAVVDVPFGLAAPGLAGRGLAAPCGLGAASLATNGLVVPGLAAPGLIAPGFAASGIAAPFGLASPLAYDGFAYPGAAPYGGAGEGNVAVAGELPVAGTTAVAGQVPIMGAVSFGGPVAAAGSVSITGKCACGSNSPIYY